MTLRALARGSAIYAAGNLLARLGGFLLLPIYLQVMTRQEFGLVALMTVVIGLLGIVCRLGLDGALMRLHFDTDDEHRAGLYRTLLATTLGVSAAITLTAAALGSHVFETIFFGVPFLPYGMLVLAITFVGSVDYVPAILYRATQQPEKFFLFNFGSFALASALSLGMVLAGFGATGALIGQLAGGSIILLVAIVIAFRAPGGTWYGHSLRPALRFGLPLVPHQLATWGLRFSDRWLLGLLLLLPNGQLLPTGQRLAAVGAYSVGYQIGNLVAIVAMSFNAAWTPYFYRVADEPEGPEIYREILTLTTLAFLWMALGLASTASEVVGVISRPGYAPAAQVLPVVAFASVSQAIYTMLVGVVLFRRQTAVLPLLTVASAFVNIVLNLSLIPRVGVMGAAWATFAAYGLFALLTFAVATRLYPVRPDYPRLVSGLLLTLAGLAVARVLTPMDEPLLIRGLIHVAITVAVGGLLLALAQKPIGRLRLRMAAAQVRAQPVAV
jgi:O-antigen/teichoic acid export membrane protein